MRIPDDMLERIDQACAGSGRTAWFLSLAARELDETTQGPARPPVAASPATGTRSIGPGILSPGVICMWAACMSRDTNRYAVLNPGELTRTDYRDHKRDEDQAGHVLRKRHAAQLKGHTYSPPMKDLPPAWRKSQNGRQAPEPAGQPA